MTAMADEPSIEEILASLDQLLEDSGIGNDDAQLPVSAAKQKEKQPELKAEDLNLDALFAETTDAEMEISESVVQAQADELPEPEAPTDVDVQASMDESSAPASELQMNVASVDDFSEPDEVDAAPIIDIEEDAAGQNAVDQTIADQTTADQTATTQETNPVEHSLEADLAAAVLDFNRGASAPEMTSVDHQQDIGQRTTERDSDETPAEQAGGAEEPAMDEGDGTASPADNASSTIQPVVQPVDETSQPDGAGEVEGPPDPAMEPAMEISEEESNPAEEVSGMTEEAAEAPNARITVDDNPEDMPSDERLASDSSEVEAQNSDTEMAGLDSEDPDMDEAVIDEASEESALLAGEAEESQSKPRLIHLSDAEAVSTNTPDLFSSDAVVPGISSAENTQERYPDAATEEADAHGVVILTQDMMVDDHQNPLPFDQHPVPSSVAGSMDAQEVAARDENEDEKTLADQSLPDSMPPAWEEAISERVARRIEDVLPALVEASVKKALKKSKKRRKRKARPD